MVGMFEKCIFFFCSDDSTRMPITLCTILFTSCLKMIWLQPIGPRVGLDFIRRERERERGLGIRAFHLYDGETLVIK